MAELPEIPQEQDRTGVMLEIDEQLVEDISELLETEEQGMLLNLVADLYPVDLARLVSHLPVLEAKKLFNWLPPELGGEVLVELDDTFRALLLKDEEPARITELLDELDTDEAADVLADLSEEIALQVLPELEDAEEVRELLAYGEETAGGIMATEYVAVLSTASVAEATEEVRRNAEAVEEIFGIFVVSEVGVLQGIISLKKLLLSPAHVYAHEIMSTDVISVKTDLDQEEVARIMERYNLVSLPVVDEAGRLVGRITIDDIVDVIREEAEEDIQRMSGISGDEEPTDSVLRITRGRLPWLMLGMLGAGLSGMVISSFEHALEQAVVLAAFIPVVTAMAGNVGIQSSAIVVQGLASGDVWSSDLLRRLGKETSVAFINGLLLALVLALGVFVLYELFGFGSEPIKLAITAGLSLFIVIILSTGIGTVIPLFLHRLGIDPALATGPFITTSNDIIGLTIYFLLASFIYL